MKYLSGLLLLLALHSAQALERWQQDAYLVESFHQVALKREYQDKGQDHFNRWRQPVRIRLVNEVGDKPLQADVVKIQAAHLSHITGHSVTLVQDPSKANLTLVMTRRSQVTRWARQLMGQSPSIQAALADGLCIANYVTDQEGAIRRASIIIPVDASRDQGRFLDCVVEELTQVMGLPNDSDAVFPSIFNDRSTDSFLTGLDYLLLKMAYHPALTPGMTQAEVDAALPAVLRSLKAQGDILQANRRVQEHSLKRWAGL
ncbi:DUF2927 domain-containing protein [Aeromonas molluscorum]|uniref:DUF2927 domain-containing protein n=1 Tax=Aeromonas molluscorum TaxID=271417 RepID=UPI003F1DF7E4